MNQDIKGVRTAQDLERKYLTQLLGLKTAVQKIDKVVYKTDTIITDFLIAVGTYRNQVDKLTTWFFSSTQPTGSQYDISYDKETGSVYQFDGDDWVEITSDGALTGVMAIANSQADTSDGFRQIFYIEPTTPYYLGDVWQNGSTIKRCRVARSEGDFVSTDWMNQEDYSEELILSDTKAVLDQTKVQIEQTYATKTELTTSANDIRAEVSSNLTETLTNYATNESVTNKVEQSARQILTDSYSRLDIQKIVEGSVYYPLTTDTIFGSGLYYGKDEDGFVSQLIAGTDYQVGDSIDEWESTNEKRVCIAESIGVSKVSTISGQFDSDGLTIDKTGSDASKTKSNLDTDGLTIYDKTKDAQNPTELMFAGFDNSIGDNGASIVRVANMKITDYFNFNEKWRQEVIYDSEHGYGIAFFYIGG